MSAETVRPDSRCALRLPGRRRDFPVTRAIPGSRRRRKSPAEPRGPAPESCVSTSDNDAYVSLARIAMASAGKAGRAGGRRGGHGLWWGWRNHGPPAELRRGPSQGAAAPQFMPEGSTARRAGCSAISTSRRRAYLGPTGRIRGPTRYFRCLIGGNSLGWVVLRTRQARDGPAAPGVQIRPRPPNGILVGSVREPTDA